MGKLTEQPLAELVREISSKSLSGALRLKHEPVETAVYFDQGQLIYAAANLRTLRLREYLFNRHVISAQDYERLDRNLPDLELAANLVARGTVRQRDLDALLVILVSDILRISLLWTEGTWDFNPRSRLAAQVQVEADVPSLLREAAQSLPINFVANRFRNPGEIIARATEVARDSNFLPSSGFMLSRLDRPLPFAELVLLSGLPEPEAQRAIYGLALTGAVKREYWRNAFREVPKADREEAPVPALSAATEHQSDRWLSGSVEEEDLEAFLARLKTATNHYEVLDLPTTAALSEIKETYYAMARRFHPDRFHLKSGTKQQAEISSAFARVTQAYETLANPNARVGYDYTLEQTRQFDAAEAKAEQAEQAEDTPGQLDFDDDAAHSGLSRAEYCFREGSSALEQGRLNAAVKLLANAALLEPQEARYRAYYGRALAADERMHRLAENEIQAAVKLEPGNATFRAMLAELYFDLKFYRRAQTEVDRALAIDPQNLAASLLLRKLQKSRKVG